MAGVVCLPFGNVVALGVRCVLGQPRAGAVRGVVRPVGGVWRYRGQRGWLAGWIGWAMDQNRHSGRSAAQTRNPCPVERDWIPAVAGMTIWLGGLCQRSGVGWLARLVWRWIKTVIPGGAERKPGIHTLLQETGLPPPLSRGQALRELCLEGMLSVSCSAVRGSIQCCLCCFGPGHHHPIWSAQSFPRQDALPVHSHKHRHLPSRHWQPG